MSHPANHLSAGIIARLIPHNVIKLSACSRVHRELLVHSLRVVHADVVIITDGLKGQ